MFYIHCSAIKSPRMRLAGIDTHAVTSDNTIFKLRSINSCVLLINIIEI